MKSSVALLLAASAATAAELPAPPLRAESGGLVVLVCNEDPARSPVYLAALPWGEDVVRWAEARAEYLRELDLQQLLRQPGERYRRLKGLVEVKYHLERARIALMAGRHEDVLKHWQAAAEAAREVAWPEAAQHFDEAARAALEADLDRYRAGNPCGLVAVRDRLEGLYRRVGTLVEAGK